MVKSNLLIVRENGVSEQYTAADKFISKIYDKKVIAVFEERRLDNGKTVIVYKFNKTERKITLHNGNVVYMQDGVVKVIPDTLLKRGMVSEFVNLLVDEISNTKKHQKEENPTDQLQVTMVKESGEVVKGLMPVVTYNRLRLGGDLRDSFKEDKPSIVLIGRVIDGFYSRLAQFTY